MTKQECAARYRQKHKKEIKAYRIKYRLENPQKVRKSDLKSKAKHVVEVKALREIGLKQLKERVK